MICKSCPRPLFTDEEKSGYCVPCTRDATWKFACILYHAVVIAPFWDGTAVNIFWE